MKGEWVEAGYREYVFKAPDGSVHARTYYNEQSARLDGKPCVVWTNHTEGNDRFADLGDAKSCGEARLLRVLEATESLR